MDTSNLAAGMVGRAEIRDRARAAERADRLSADVTRIAERIRKGQPAAGDALRLVGHTAELLREIAALEAMVETGNLFAVETSEASGDTPPTSPS